MKHRLILAGICVGVLLLATSCSAAIIVAQSHHDYYNVGVIWKSDPFDAFNATPLNPYEYYLVDEYLYINPESGYLRLIYVYMGFDGIVNYAVAPMSDYYMHRIPDVGGKYELGQWGVSGYYSSGYTQIP
jgi:hypothetical protein